MADSGTASSSKETADSGGPQVHTYLEGEPSAVLPPYLQNPPIPKQDVVSQFHSKTQKYPQSSSSSMVFWQESTNAQFLVSSFSVAVFYFKFTSTIDLFQPTNLFLVPGTPNSQLLGFDPAPAYHHVMVKPALEYFNHHEVYIGQNLQLLSAQQATTQMQLGILHAMNWYKNIPSADNEDRLLMSGWTAVDPYSQFRPRSWCDEDVTAFVCQIMTIGGTLSTNNTASNTSNTYTSWAFTAEQLKNVNYEVFSNPLAEGKNYGVGLGGASTTADVDPKHPVGKPVFVNNIYGPAFQGAMGLPLAFWNTNNVSAANSGSGQGYASNAYNFSNFASRSRAWDTWHFLQVRRYMFANLNKAVNAFTPMTKVTFETPWCQVVSLDQIDPVFANTLMTDYTYQIKLERTNTLIPSFSLITHVPFIDGIPHVGYALESGTAGQPSAVYFLAAPTNTAAYDSWATTYQSQLASLASNIDVQVMGSSCFLYKKEMRVDAATANVLLIQVNSTGIAYAYIHWETLKLQFEASTTQTFVLNTAKTELPAYCIIAITDDIYERSPFVPFPWGFDFDNIQNFKSTTSLYDNINHSWFTTKPITWTSGNYGVTINMAGWNNPQMSCWMLDSNVKENMNQTEFAPGFAHNMVSKGRNYYQINLSPSGNSFTDLQTPKFQGSHQITMDLFQIFARPKYLVCVKGYPRTGVFIKGQLRCDNAITPANG